MRKPTFLLKPSAYKSAKLYSILPDDGGADFTWTAGSANRTRVNKDGYIEDASATTPRIDYLYRPGVLLEPTRTNQFTQSEVVTGQFTATSVTVTDNDTIAPDGTKTADKVLDNDETAAGAIDKTITVSDGTAIHTISFFVKFGDRTDSKYEITTGATTETAVITIDSTGTTAVETDTTPIIDAVGSDIYPNGWIRFWCIVDMNNANTTINLKIYPAGDDVDLEGYIWVWGFQLEEGAGMTSYIPTTTATIGGNDSGNVSSMITADVFSTGATGSLYCEFTYPQQIADTPSSVAMKYGGTDSISIEPPSSSYAFGQLEVKNEDATSTTYALTRAYNKVVWNMFGDTTEVWLNGTKVITTGKDMSLDTNTLTIAGTACAWKLHEMAGWESTLTDEESQRITG